MQKHETFREFLSGPRSELTPPAWNEGKMPKSGAQAMEMSKNRKRRLGTGWRWCFIAFEVRNHPHKLWVCYHPGKENYQAVICKSMQDGDLLALACLENHGTHPGWHIHGCCATVEASSHGRTHYEAMIRVPPVNAYSRPLDFPTNDEAALDIAARHFRLKDLRAKEVQLKLPS